MGRKELIPGACFQNVSLLVIPLLSVIWMTETLLSTGRNLDD